MQQEGGDKEDGQRDSEVDGDRLRDDDDDDDDEDEKQGSRGEKDGDEQEEEEEEESEFDLRNHLRDNILETVDECLTAWEKGRVQDAVAPRDPLHRCVVCTLPHGACHHTPQWLDAQDRFPILDPLPKDSVDLSMDDISDILEPATAIHREGAGYARGAPSLSNLGWEIMRAQPADELSGEKVDLSSPPSRAGHTMVLFNGANSLREDGRLLVVFGGVSIANSEQALAHAQSGARNNHGERHSGDKHFLGEGGVSEQALSYHADVRFFRVGFSTWHCPDATGDLPEGRYGHVSLALDDGLMWMFGGRLKGGHQASDTYVLNVQNMRWDRTNTASHGEPNPAPRAWSAAVEVRQRVFLFGGTDLRSGRMFDDLWAWDVQTRSWGEHIVVGTPPLARYGHVLLACPDEQILVLGGCCVSSLAETGLPADNDSLNLRVRVAAVMVNHAYQLEEEETAVGAPYNFENQGGTVRRSEKGDIGRCPDSRGSSYPAPASCKELSRREAQLAAAVAAREKDTAVREEKLRAVLDERVAMTHWAKLRSLHPLKELDATFLDTRSMIWGVVNPPPIGGGKTAPPVARMHFSAVVLGQKVVLWGGCLPTSKRMETVDGGVHVFDLVRRRWSAPVGQQHPDGIQPRVDAAVVQLRRAERALFEATQRAMTMGAPGGRTMQVIQAEAVIAVNRWRVRRLEHEIRCAAPSPRPRAAHAGCALGHRVMYFGGWGAEDSKGEFLVLDIEEPTEKERRLEDEFHIRLDRERQQRETAEAEALRRAAMQENMRKGLELAQEMAETAAMSAEDARSAIPELTIAPVPRLRCANASTLWLEWDRPKVDAIGNPPGDRVEYTLYMCGGFREWAVGDHVLVEYMSRAQRKAVASSSVTTLSVTDCDSMARGLSPVGGSLGRFGSVGSTSAGGGQNDGGGSNSKGEGNHKTPIDKTMHSNELRKEDGGNVPPDSVGHSEPRLLPAVIIAPSNGDGMFDIRWGDGERERGVRRYRIHGAASPSPTWAAIYRGEDCHYAVQGMLPESVVHRERDFRYEVSARFSLQTKGTEVPRDKQSRHSPVVTMRTHFEGQGPRDEGRWLGKGGPPGSVKARLATAKALDSSISAAGGPTHSSLSRVRPAHGQYVATGRGKLYV